MLIPRDVFHLVGCACKDLARSQLQGIYFHRKYDHGPETPLQAWATDGKILARALFAEQDPADFPAAPGVDPAGKPGGFEVTIPSETCTAIRKAFPRKPAVKPALDCAALDENAANGTATMCVTDLETVQKWNPEPLGRYPAVDDVFDGSIAKGKIKAQVHFNPFLLIRALQTMVDAAGLRANMTLDEMPTCTMTVRDTSKPTVFEIKAKSYVGLVTVAVMPVITSK